MKVNFDPSTRLITGQVEIEYVNNSLDTLKQLWFKLYPILKALLLSNKSRALLLAAANISSKSARRARVQ